MPGLKLKQSAIDNVKGLNERLKLKQSALDQVKTQSQTAGKETGSEKPWWETVLGYLGGVQDTSLPVHTTQQVAQGYREQEAAMLSPGKSWTAQQRNSFDSLLSQDRNKAREYAYTVNSERKSQQEAAQIQKIQNAATKNFGAGAAHTAGALLTAPLGMADYLGDLIAQGTLGYVPKTDGQVTPFEYSQAATGGISQNLNEKYGTIDEKIPVIGGKGLGDVYGLGTSIAQSSLAAFTGGGGQALIQFFGSSAASGVDDALRRGASGEQATAYGTMVGLAEGLAEMIGVDNLMKIGSASTLRQFVGNLLKQGAAEGLEEGITALLNNFADNLVMGDKSNFHALVAQYMANGMREEAAKKKAWASMAEDIAFDMLGGFVSGSVHAAPQTAYQTYRQNRTTADKNTRQPQQTPTQTEKLLEGIFPSTPNTAPDALQTAEKAQQDYVSGLLEGILPDTKTAATADPVSAAVEAFRTTGTVTNKLATNILNSANAVTQIVEETGVKLPETASGRRAAIKQAIAELSQKQPAAPVDTGAQTDYDTINNTKGGNIYADTEQTGLPGPSEAGLPGGVGAERLRGTGPQAVSVSGPAPAGVGTGSRMGAGSLEAGSGSGGSGVQLRVSPLLRVSPELTAAQAARSTPTYPVQDTTADPARYAQALLAGRISDAKNGWCVTPKSAQELTDGNVRTLMNESGTVGVGIAPDGDIVAVFKNPNGGPKKALDTLMPIAIEQGGTKLDCYGEGLVRTYEKYGFTAVARVEFNPEYANEGWTPDKGQPYIYFMAHNGQSASQVASSIGTYPHATQEQLAALPTYGKDDYDAAMTYRDSLLEKQSTEGKAPSHPAPDESVGAAPSGFDPISHLQYAYGTLPEGENPVRPDDLPVSTDGKDRVSQTAVTVKGAKVTPDDFVDLLHKDVAEGKLSYIPITNNATTQAAIDHITKEGWEAAKAGWSAAVRAGKTGADLSAIGALLLNNAAKAGDKAAWREILHDYQRMGTNTAQGLQALRILKTLEPTDKLYMIKRSVEQMAEDLQVDVELDEELLHEYEEAETEEARNEALDKIQQSIANQLPATFLDKWTALRYVNMLGNLRTQVRNVAGNAGMKAVSSVKNALAAVMEDVAHKASGGKLEKTKSLTVSKEQLQAAKADFDNFKSLVLGNGKYADSMTASEEFAQAVQDKRTVFKNKALEGYRKVTSWAMEKGDLVFSKAAYARALAGYLKAQGVTETDYTKVSASIMDNARLYAAQEAQEQTFRDTNWLSGWVTKIGRRKDTPAVGKLLSEGILPFRKTPANVLIRAEEYSPLGLINSLYYSAKAAQKGSEITGAQVINSWAKTLTGTGLFGLGMLLSNLGFLSGGPNEEDKEEDFEALNGWQNYALVLPDGTNITVDWLTPAAMPLLMGAQLMELVQDGGFQLKDLEKALLSIADPMVEMSMLQGINDTLENVRYAENNLGQVVINAALGYLTQGLTNTLAGQLERTFEDSRMTTFVDQDSALPDWLQRALGKASAKTPGVDYNQIPYINAWGQEEENPQWWLNGLYNTLSPGYIEKGVTDDVSRELNRLNAAQGDKNVYPSTPDKTITINKQKRNLSAEEYVALAKLQGQTARRIVEDLIGSEYYTGLSDQQKAKAISYAYDYAREYARVETLEDYTEYSSKWMEGLGGNALDAILRKVATGSVDKFADLPIDQATYVNEILEALKDAPRERKPDGSLYVDVRYVQQVEAITGSTLTEEQQTQIMDEVLDDSDYAKYLKILDQGYSNDDYAAALRIYLDAEKTKTQTKKQVTIREFMDEMNLSRSAAEALYKLYSGAK